MSHSSRLEIYHSRPVVPTRRIALGECQLDNTPINPDRNGDSNLTLGGLLLAAIVGRYSSSLHPDLWDDMELLIERAARAAHIPQPCLRFRLQTDKVGLAKSTHTLIMNTDGEFDLYFGVHNHSAAYSGSAVQQLLGALYAAKSLEPKSRASCISAIRTGLGWWGTNTDSLINYILDCDPNHSSHRPKAWALKLLGIDNLNPTGAEVQRHFRQKLWDIHPDRGGDPIMASELINDLAEARRQLLSLEVH